MHGHRITPPAVLLASALSLAACFDETPQPVAPLQPRTTQVGPQGTYAVGFTYYMLHDASRANRPIPVYVWYPVDPSSITAATQPAQYPLEPFTNALPNASSLAFEQFGVGAAWQEPPAADGPFPLVMYSPGWGGNAYMTALSLATEIVKHGFVVASVTHWGDQAAPVLVPGEALDHLALASYNRPRDISFTLTNLLEKNAAATGLLSGVIDPATIYASGWSLGGYAAMVLAAGDDGLCDMPDAVGAPPEACGATAPDARITAIIPIDGSNQLLHFAELARVRVPVLGIGQEWTSAGSVIPGWQARGHAAYSGSPSYRVDVVGTIHVSFANICEAYQALQSLGIQPRWGPGMYWFACVMPSTPAAEVHRIVNQYVLAFLTHRQSVLTPGFALTSEPLVEFFVTERRSPSSIDEENPLFVYFMHQPGRGHGDLLTATGEKNPTGHGPDAYGIARLSGGWGQ